MDVRNKNNGAPPPAGPTPPPRQQELPLSGAIEPTRTPPIWRQRLALVLYCCCSLAIGYVLVLLPWRPSWSHHALLAHYLSAQRILATGFVRGLVSGMGLVNIWLAVWAAMHYRDRHPSQP